MRKTGLICSPHDPAGCPRLRRMKETLSIVTNHVSTEVAFAIQPADSQLSFLYLVSAEDLRNMRDAIIRGTIATDFETKLKKLAGGSLLHRAVEQHCRLFISLLMATENGGFTEADESACDRLLRVLAYVRKDDDALPDYKPDGFADDQREVRAAATELGELLQTFKEWRLRHQVPRMWLPTV